MANPPIDDVFKECFAAMNDGAGFFKKTVTEEAYGVLKARYYKNFLMQLKASPHAWEKSKGNVLHAARHIGMFAAVLAGFHKASEVEAPHAEVAGTIMEQHCTARDRGQWCEPTKTAFPNEGE